MSDLTKIIDAASPDRRSSSGMSGRILVARRDAPVPSEHTDLSNVVPFARPGGKRVDASFPLPAIAAEDRPAPSPLESGPVRRVALLTSSLVLHVAPLALFLLSAPAPVASIGAEVFSVEVTFGANTAAGLATVPGEQEVQVAAPAEDQKAEQSLTERTTVATVMPQDVPVASQDTAPEVKEQRPETPTAEVRPQEQQTETSTEPPVPQIKTALTAEERKRIDAPTQKDAAKQEQSAAAVPTDTASGIGHGRSDITADIAAKYNGSVATHLTRHLQYPAAARRAGAKGVATVVFTVDGGGHVTSVTLESSSGFASLDQEAVATVRRASPFPAPPVGHAGNFTVPVRFNVR
jgi:protein TonB